MERNKKQFRIHTNHKDLLLNAIEKFNNVYKTDFSLVEYVWDEVNYAIIEYESASDDKIFNLGYQFGGFIMHLRNKGEISD